MKSVLKIFLLLCLICFGRNTYAQSKKDKIEELRMAFIDKKLELTNAEHEKFWPVYNEYNDKVRAVRKNLRQSYRKAPENMSEQEAEELYQLDLKSKQAELDLHKTYAEKIKAIIGVKKTVMLRDAEEEFRQQVLSTLKEKNGN